MTEEKIILKGREDHCTFTVKYCQGGAQTAQEILGFAYTAAAGSNADFWVGLTWAGWRFCSMHLTWAAQAKQGCSGCSHQVRQLSARLLLLAAKIAILSYLACTSTEFPQADRVTASTYLLKENSKNLPAAYCRWMGYVEFSLGRDFVLFSQTIHSQS